MRFSWYTIIQNNHGGKAKIIMKHHTALQTFAFEKLVVPKFCARLQCVWMTDIHGCNVLSRTKSVVNFQNLLFCIVWIIALI